MKREGNGPPQKLSGSTWVRFRLVEIHAVKRAIERAYESFPRTDDAMTAVSFALEHDPKAAGFPVERRPGVSWLKCPGRSSISLPEVTVLYTVQDDLVTLESIRFLHDGVIFHSAAFEQSRHDG
jgi:hypothetical protein